MVNDKKDTLEIITVRSFFWRELNFACFFLVVVSNKMFSSGI